MNNTIDINTGNRNFRVVLKDPEFKDYQTANIALQNEYGVDNIAAGRIVLKNCWVEGGEIVDGKDGYINEEDFRVGDNSKDPIILKAYITACVEAYQLLNLFESDLKKN